MHLSTLSKTLLAIVASLGIALGVAIGSAPLIVEKRLVKEAGARGFDLTLEQLELGRRQTVMRGIRLEHRAGHSSASIDEITIDASLWGLFRRRAAAIDDLTIRGLEADVDLRPIFARRRARAAGDAEDEPSSSRTFPPTRLEGASIRTREGAAPFVDLELETFVILGGEAMTMGAQLRYPLSRGALTIENLSSTIDLHERQIESISIATLDLSALRSAEESEQIIARIRRLIEGEARSDVEASSHQADEDALEGIDDSPSGSPSEKAKEEENEEEREPAQKQAEQEEQEEPEEDQPNDHDGESEAAKEPGDQPDGRPEKEPSSFRERLARASDRIGPRFRMTVGKTILPSAEGFGSFRVEELNIQREEEQGLAIKGRGQDDADARADFDLRLSLSELRAEGRIDVERLRLGAIASFIPWVPFHEPENARLDASLLLTAESLEEIAYEAEIDLHDVGFYSPRIAADPIVDLEFGLTATGGWERAERTLRIASGEIRLGKAKALVDGTLRLLPEALGVDIKMSLPRLPCEDAVHSLPRAILGSASAFHFRGMISGELALSFEWERLDELALSLKVRNDCRFIDWPREADPSRFQRFFVHEALSPDGEPFDFETGPMTEVWAPLESLSPYLLPAFLAHEDAAFLRHPGFSVFAIRESLIRNLSRGRFERGASTISMQLAKNLFLNREKVLVRKLREVIYTWWLESAFGKEQILELYANVVELGPYLYGVKSASLHYFGREPAELSPAEAAFLATSLPAPRRAGEQYERGELSRSGRSRIGNLLRNMKRRGLISEEAAEYGLEELDGFRFYRRGDPLPPERILPESPPLFEFESEPEGDEAGEEINEGAVDDMGSTFPNIYNDPWGFR